MATKLDERTDEDRTAMGQEVIPPPDDPEPASPFTPEESKPRRRRGRPPGSKNGVRQPRTRRSKRLEKPLSLAWMAMGFGLERVGPEPVAVPMGRVMQIQAPRAGEVLADVLDRTPLGPIITPWIDVAGPWTDLASLILPPLLVGMVALKPQLGVALKPLLVQQLVPVLADAQKRAREQAELMNEINQYDQESIDQASQFVDALINPDHMEEAA